MMTKFMVRLGVGALIAIGVFLTFACTEQQRARKLGGTYTVNLPACTKLVTATWKEADLWTLERRAHPGELPEELIFKEDSPFGLIEGTVVFREGAVDSTCFQAPALDSAQGSDSVAASP